MSSKDRVIETLKRLEQYQPTRGEIYAVDGPTADVIPIGGMGLLRRVEIYGSSDNLSVGDNVLMTWVDKPGTPGKVPVIFAQAGSAASATIDGSDIALGSITPEHLSFEIAQGESDSLWQAGWRITSVMGSYTPNKHRSILPVRLLWGLDLTF